jgi:hypothetical protein
LTVFGARQNAGRAVQLGEFAVIEPAALIDGDRADPAGDAAEPANPNFEECAKQRVMGCAPHQAGRLIGAKQAFPQKQPFVSLHLLTIFPHLFIRKMKKLLNRPFGYVNFQLRI